MFLFSDHILACEELVFMCSMEQLCEGKTIVQVFLFSRTLHSSLDHVYFVVGWQRDVRWVIKQPLVGLFLVALKSKLTIFGFWVMFLSVISGKCYGNSNERSRLSCICLSVLNYKEYIWQKNSCLISQTSNCLLTGKLTRYSVSYLTQ